MICHTVILKLPFMEILRIKWQKKFKAKQTFCKNSNCLFLTEWASCCYGYWTHANIRFNSRSVKTFCWRKAWAICEFLHACQGSCNRYLSLIYSQILFFLIYYKIKLNFTKSFKLHCQTFFFFQVTTLLIFLTKYGVPCFDFTLN